MLPIFRWTIGPVQPAGFDCLKRSIKSATNLYECEAVICHNRLNDKQLDELHDLRVRLLSQETDPAAQTINPIGVAWKLIPPRLDINRREIFIDNDLIIVKRIPEIDYFLASSSTLLLEADSRTYGQFDRHVPPDKNINSGLFGLPIGFDLQRYISFYVDDWQINSGSANELSKTFDEQGLVAFVLLSHPDYKIISSKTITNCEHHFESSFGMHFVGLNRVLHHRAYAHYKSTTCRLYL